MAPRRCSRTVSPASAPRAMRSPPRRRSRWSPGTTTTNQASLLQGRLRLISGRSGVTVAFDAARQAYEISMTGVTGALTPIIYDAGAGLLNAAPKQNTSGQLTLPLDIAGAVLKYQGQTRELLLAAATPPADNSLAPVTNAIQRIALAGDAAAQISYGSGTVLLENDVDSVVTVQAKLRTLTGDAGLTVTAGGAGTSGNPWRGNFPAGGATPALSPHAG